MTILLRQWKKSEVSFMYSKALCIQCMSSCFCRGRIWIYCFLFMMQSFCNRSILLLERWWCRFCCEQSGCMNFLLGWVIVEIDESISFQFLHFLLLPCWKFSLITEFSKDSTAYLKKSLNFIKIRKNWGNTQVTILPPFLWRHTSITFHISRERFLVTIWPFKAAVA